MPRGALGTVRYWLVEKIGVPECRQKNIEDGMRDFLSVNSDIYLAEKEDLAATAAEYMASDEAHQFFSDGHGLNYSWSDEHGRLLIQEAVEHAMTTQQANAIERLHRLHAKSGTACTSCRYDREVPGPTTHEVEVIIPSMPPQTGLPSQQGESVSLQSSLQAFDQERPASTRRSLRRSSNIRNAALGLTIDESSSDEDAHLEDPDYSETPRKRSRTGGSTPSTASRSTISVLAPSTLRATPSSLHPEILTAEPEDLAFASPGPSLVRAVPLSRQISLPPLSSHAESPGLPILYRPIEVKIGGKTYRSNTWSHQANRLALMVTWLIEEKYKYLQAQSTSDAAYHEKAYEFATVVENYMEEHGFEPAEHA